MKWIKQTIEILNNNLTISQIKIPQNNKSFFYIHKNKRYEKTIEIVINHSEEIFFLNLYLILKSYCLNSIYIPLYFLITVKNDDNVFITYNKDINFIKKMTYNKFLIWYITQFKEDEKYLNSTSIYSYNIVFHSNKSINDLTPIYPWKNDIINFFWKNLSEEISYQEIIENKNKLIEKLQKEIEDLKK